MKNNYIKRKKERKKMRSAGPKKDKRRG